MSHTHTMTVERIPYLCDPVSFSCVLFHTIFSFALSYLCWHPLNLLSLEPTRILTISRSTHGIIACCPCVFPFSDFSPLRIVSLNAALPSPFSTMTSYQLIETTDFSQSLLQGNELKPLSFNSLCSFSADGLMIPMLSVVTIGSIDNIIVTVTANCLFTYSQ